LLVDGVTANHGATALASPQDASIAKYEVELKRRGDEIERKTRETDALNRKLEKLLAAQPGEQ
jgi:ubiquinone biosynthesis protein UbiJ